MGAAAATLNNFGNLGASVSSSSVTTEGIAVLPPSSSAASSYIAPTETQKTAGPETTVGVVLPLSTTKTGTGGRVSPIYSTWTLVLIYAGGMILAYAKP